MVYVPPSATAVDQYVKEVSQRLSQTVDPVYDTTEMRVELTAFIKVVFDTYAKYLAKQRSAGSSSAKKEDEYAGGKNELVQTP